VLVYFFKPEVAAGWTTLSLQISGMMFIFSILFVFFAEYLIQLTSANPTRSRRHLVFREIRSRLSRRSRRLNVVDPAGNFKLGAPAHIFAEPGEAQ
jgi:polyisoprenyl-phosphate glycosyltransferase